MARKHGSFVVIGLGNFGGTIASELKRFDNYVIGIDSDSRRVSDFAEHLDQALILDARDVEALRDAGVEECSTGLVSLGDDFESSVLATMNLKLVGIEMIWAKANSKAHHRILSHLGVTRVVHPEREVGRQMAQILHNPMIRDHVSLGNGYNVVNLRVPETLEGKPVEALPLERHRLRCVGVMRGSKFAGDHQGGGCTLRRDDLLLLLGKRDDLRDFTSNI